MNPIELRKLLKLAIEKMLQDDESRKPCRGLLRSAERNITAHLRTNLEQSLTLFEGYQCYQVDHEYNRMGDGKDPKYSPKIGKGREGNFVPDIAIHRRGIQASSDPKANLLVLEIKQIATFAGSPKRIRNKKVRRALSEDLSKLKVLRDRKDQFQYQHAGSVVFSSDKVWVAWDGSPFEKLMCLPPRHYSQCSSRL